MGTWREHLGRAWAWVPGLDIVVWSDKWRKASFCYGDANRRADGGCRWQSWGQDSARAGEAWCCEWRCGGNIPAVVGACAIWCCGWTCEFEWERIWKRGGEWWVSRNAAYGKECREGVCGRRGVGEGRWCAGYYGWGYGREEESVEYWEHHFGGWGAVSSGVLGVDGVR